MSGIAGSMEQGAGREKTDDRDQRAEDGGKRRDRRICKAEKNPSWSSCPSWSINEQGKFTTKDTKKRKKTKIISRSYAGFKGCKSFLNRILKSRLCDLCRL